MNTKMIENAKEVRDLVFLSLQDHNDWVTSTTIASELGLGREQVKTALGKLKTENPEIISNRTFGYKITTPRKNSEGYSDPTAKAAIDNVSDEKFEFSTKKEHASSIYGARYDNIVAGSLWEASSSSTNTEYFFVIKPNVNDMPVALGVTVFNEKQDRFPDRKIDICVESILDGNFLGDMSCLRCKPMKYFKREITIKKPTETLTSAKHCVSDMVCGHVRELELDNDLRVARYKIESWKKCTNKSTPEEAEMAMLEEYQRGLKDGQQKGYDIGYADGKKEADEERTTKETSIKDREFDADIVQLNTERNLYKTFYEQLLEVMRGGSK